jgi:hypothetical protein
MRLLCLACGAESVITEGASVPGCPECGDRQGIPADLDDTVDVHISKHELRILTMWADNHARSIKMPHVTRIILDRLGTQTDAPLTLGQEIADVRAAFPDAEIRVYDDHGNEQDL